MNRWIIRKKGMLAGVIILILCLFCSCKSQGSQSNHTKNANQKFSVVKEEDNYDTVFTGIIEGYNLDKKTVSVFNIQEKKNYEFVYTGGTDIKDKYDALITMPQVEIGEIVDVYYYQTNQKLTLLHISKEAWTYKKVGNLETDKTNLRMKIANHNYWYDEGLQLFSQEEPIELIDLHEKDELMVKGIGSQICSIIVVKGHGYIRLTNYHDFIGGTIEVGYGIITPIVKDMLIVAKEGEYNVVLENGELVAKKDIKLKRNEEITLDFSEYKMPEERIGYVRFDIDPYGADLYINGRQINYADPIKLNYGTHRIRVTMNGYNEFNGILTIGETTPTISIRLAQGTYDVESEDSQTGEKVTSSNTTIEQTQEEDDLSKTENEEENSKTKSIDKNHTITIESPVGATLYMDGEQIGTVPISVEKEIGTHVVVFSQSGYATKSYSIEVLDDNQNAVFNFPDMIILEE